MEQQPDFKSMMKSVRAEGTGIPDGAFRKAPSAVINTPDGRTTVQTNWDDLNGIFDAESAYDKALDYGLDYANRQGPRNPSLTDRSLGAGYGEIFSELAARAKAVDDAKRKAVTPNVRTPEYDWNAPQTKIDRNPFSEEKGYTPVGQGGNGGTGNPPGGGSGGNGGSGSNGGSVGDKVGPGPEPNPTPKQKEEVEPKKEKENDDGANKPSNSTGSDSNEKKSPKETPEKTETDKARDPGKFENGADDSNGEDDGPVTKSDPILDAISMMRYGHPFQKATECCDDAQADEQDDSNKQDQVGTPVSPLTQEKDLGGNTN